MRTNGILYSYYNKDIGEQLQKMDEEYHREWRQGRRESKNDYLTHLQESWKVEENLITYEYRTDPLNKPKEELVGKLNDQEKEVLAYLLDWSGLDHTITGKNVLSPQQTTELHKQFDKEYWEENDRWIASRRRESEEREREAWKLAEPIEPEQRDDVKAHLGHWQEIQERERENRIPTPEEAGLNLDRLEAVRKKLNELQDQELHPTPTVEEVRHLASLPDAADPQDREDVQAQLATWKEQTRRRRQFGDDEGVA